MMLVQHGLENQEKFSVAYAIDLKSPLKKGL